MHIKHTNGYYMQVEGEIHLYFFSWVYACCSMRAIDCTFPREYPLSKECIVQSISNHITYKIYGNIKRTG